MKQFILALLVLSTFRIAAQQVPMNYSMSTRIESFLVEQSPPMHTSFRPWMLAQFSNSIPDSIVNPRHRLKFSHTLVGRKIFNENLVKVDTGGFFLTLDPLFSFVTGKSNRHVWLNSRGFTLNGRIGKDFWFGSDFTENQAVFPDYLDALVRQTEMVPGQGRAKLFKTDGFDYANASGYISYTPSRFFNIRFGHGKHFIGDGYRSLLLSDAAYSYPYLRLTTTVWKLQLTNLWTEFLDRTVNSPDLGYQRKYGSFQYLSANIGKHLNLGFFEAVIWESADSTAHRGFDVNYLNPVVFYRPVEFSLGSPDNMLMGLNFSYTFGRSYRAYGQLILDEFNLKDVLKQNGWVLNKQGFQLGLAGWNVLSVPNLHLRTEINVVRPYTYQHRNGLQCYGHFSQPLAHPYGANFRESVTIASWSWKFFSVEVKVIAAEYGLDTAGINFGKDIFQSYLTYPKEYGNTIGQGLKTRLIRNDLVLAYLINPTTNLRLEAGFSYRNESNNSWNRHNNVVWIGLSTRLSNQYFDF